MTTKEALEEQLKICQACKREAKPTKAVCNNCSYKASIRALGKRVPEKPITYFNDFGSKVYHCRACSKNDEIHAVCELDKFCPNCGQKLDWSKK